MKRSIRLIPNGTENDPRIFFAPERLAFARGGKAYFRIFTTGCERNRQNRLALLTVGYRLSKFQDCLPERFVLEVLERYLPDVEGTVGRLNKETEH